ncbi:MAG: hypothetical protein ACOYMN_26475, partial [Roseimicrobium sp.]
TLGDLADGQSVSFDLMLSLLTGTKVTLPEGGGNTHPGSGHCNGGSSHAGGADFEFEDIDQEGTFFAEFSEADDDEMQEREDEGEFALPTFQTPEGTVTQRWNLRYTGGFTGRIRLTMGYNPALLPANFDQSKLAIYHFHYGAWEQMVGRINTTNHTITFTTDSLSPFALGVATADAVPTIHMSSPAPGSLRLQWTSDTTGWVLQESTTLAPDSWTNSARAIQTVGNVSEVTVSGAEGARFFRLSHP